MGKSLQTGTCLLCPLDLQPLYLFPGLCVFPVAHIHLPCSCYCVASYLSLMLFSPPPRHHDSVRLDLSFEIEFVCGGAWVCRVKTSFVRLNCQISIMM